MTRFRVKDLDKKQGQQILAYNEIFSHISDAYPTFGRIDAVENNVSGRFIIDDSDTLPNPSDWDIEGGSGYFDIYLSLWARDDWNPTENTVNVVTELSSPALYTPVWYDLDTAEVIGELWEKPPSQLGFGGDYFSAVQEGDGYKLKGNAEGEMTVRIVNDDVEAAAERLIARIEDIADGLAKFWERVAKTEGALLA